MLSESLATPAPALAALHDVVMLDLDGVVYRGGQPVPGAAASLERVAQGSSRLAYITNNASLPASAVAEKLRGMGMPLVDDGDVVTSAQAVARRMSHDLPVGARVLVVGGEGLRVPLREYGFECVDSLDAQPDAVVQGFSPDLAWKHLAQAAYAVQGGARWYASNTDLTVPTAHGIAPGNGSLVHAVHLATGQQPIVAGKPERGLFDETAARTGASSPLMVGDRLDTDIEGAVRAKIDSLLVLTGVSTLADAFAARPFTRPTYVGSDLSVLHEPLRPVVIEADGANSGASCGDARVEARGSAIGLVSGTAGSFDVLRAATALAWDILDRGGDPLTSDGTLEA
jgi:glycerol 3-phosphatase-2